MSDQDRIWLPSEASKRGPAWQAALRAISAAEREYRPYLLDLEWIGPARVLGGTLVESNYRILAMLVEDLPKMRYVVGIRSRLGKTSAEPRLTLKLRDEEQTPVPAGTLLVNLERPYVAGDVGNGLWTRAIREALAANVMARADAEYAAAIDLPERSGHDRETALLRGMGLARAVALALPARPGRRPKLLDLSLQFVGDSASSENARIRVWRLGFMKIPSRSRIA